MQDLAFAIPGIDEAMGFAEVMSNSVPLPPLTSFPLQQLTLLHHLAEHVKSMQFSVIVFDTAPTGHTLRFLSFPSVLEKALGKLSTLSGKFGPMLNQVSSMMGAGVNTGEMFEKLESMRAVVTEVNLQVSGGGGRGAERLGGGVGGLTDLCLSVGLEVQES